MEKENFDSTKGIEKIEKKWTLECKTCGTYETYGRKVSELYCNRCGNKMVEVKEK